MVQESQPVVHSTTPFGLALGPDSLWEDELDPENLRQTVGKILTSLSILTPAFSLLYAPALLTVYLQRIQNAPLPLYKYNPQLR